MDSSSRGLYALAFAPTLAERKDPSKVVYSDGAKFHTCTCLLQCVLAKKLTCFYKGPALNNPGPPLKSMFSVCMYSIYRSCRLLDRVEMR